MLLSAILLSASLGAADPAAVAPPLQEPQAQPAPAAAPETGSAQAAIDAGLKAFARGRFARAAEEFEKAVAADGQSAAAHFYLGYARYKQGEPNRRMNDNKQRARDEFAKAYELDPAFRPVWAAKKK